MSLLDFYLGSKEIKRVIVQRSTDLQLPLRFICNEIKYDYRIFMEGYINSVDNDRCTLTEDQFEKILNLLGVNVKHLVIIDTAFDAEAQRNKLRERYDNRNKNVKRNS